AVDECAAAAGAAERCLPAMRRGDEEGRAAMEALRDLYLAGVPVRWERVLGDSAPAALDLRSERAGSRPRLFALSGEVPGAVQEAAQRLLSHLEAHPEQGLTDLAYSLAVTRTHHEERLAVVAATREELAQGLREAARGEVPTAGARARAVASPKVVFVFSGN